jgi:pimeloyl-ACP methyl ester carboxylesterase
MRGFLFASVLFFSVPLAAGASTRKIEQHFPCGDAVCAGTLVVPAGVDRPPVVVMAHGFAGTRDLQLPDFARIFAAHGIAAFYFDYRSFGGSGGEPRQMIDMKAQLDDWASALVHLRKTADVDGGRIALWGSSLSGGSVLIAAARDGHVRAVVAQVPLVDTEADGTEPAAGYIWNVLWTASYDTLRGWLGLSPYYIPVVSTPDTFAVINFPGALKTMLALVPEGSPWRNEVGARLFFSLAKFQPKDHIAAVQVPVLFLPARNDTIVPLASVEAAAKAAPRGEITVLEGGHFSLYSEPELSQSAEIEARFLVRHLSAAP